MTDVLKNLLTIIDFIEDNLTKELSMELISRKSGFTHFHLHRILKMNSQILQGLGILLREQKLPKKYFNSVFTLSSSIHRIFLHAHIARLLLLHSFHWRPFQHKLIPLITKSLHFHSSGIFKFN